MNDVKIYRTPRAPSERAERRELEREAASKLVAGVFGHATVIAHEDDGRPYLPTHPGVCISLSHCVDECVLAVSDSPVGVDVETARPQLSRIAAKFLTSREMARGPHDVDALLRYWTAKEAVFKCAGMPSLVISEIELSDDMSHATARGESFELEYMPSPGKLLAIARRG